MAKRILITGGGGFIAHHLINQVLIRTDWDIVTLDRLDYRIIDGESLYGLHVDTMKRITCLEDTQMWEAPLDPVIYYQQALIFMY